MDSQGSGGSQPERKLALVPAMTAEQRRQNKLRLEEAVRERFLRGERKGAIARDLGVEISFVTHTLARYHKELEHAPTPDAQLYRHRMIEALERLKARCYAALDRSEEERKKTRSEQFRGLDGKIVGSKVTVEHAVHGMDSKLAAILVVIELKLGQLHGVEQATEAAPTLLRQEYYYVSPARPIDLDKLAQLNRVIEAREVRAIGPGKGNGKGNGNAA